MLVSHVWRCRLSAKRRAFAVDEGFGHNGRLPEVGDVRGQGVGRLLILVDEQAFAPLRDRPHQPLPKAQADGVEPLADVAPGAGNDGLRRFVPEVDGTIVRAQQVSGALGHQFEESREI